MTRPTELEPVIAMIQQQLSEVRTEIKRLQGVERTLLQQLEVAGGSDLDDGEPRRRKRQTADFYRERRANIQRLVDDQFEPEEIAKTLGLSRKIVTNELAAIRRERKNT